MKAAPFDYVAPKSLAEASAALASEVRPRIAGGQRCCPCSLAGRLPPSGRYGGLEPGGACRDAGNGCNALDPRIGDRGRQAPEAFGGLMQRVASTISYRAFCAITERLEAWRLPIRRRLARALMALGAQVRIAGLKGTRSQPVSDFVLGQYSTSLAADEIILGFDVPRSDTALRWGFFKVVRKSGAFANSIAFAVARGRGGSVSVVLAAAADRPHFLPTVAARIETGESSEEALRDAIAKDVAAHNLNTILSNALTYVDRSAGRARCEQMKSATLELNGAKIAHDVSQKVTSARNDATDGDTSRVRIRARCQRSLDGQAHDRAFGGGHATAVPSNARGQKTIDDGVLRRHFTMLLSPMRILYARHARDGVDICCDLRL